jgi:hypothetical protein
MIAGFLRAFLLFCLKVPMLLLGLVVVWVALKGKLRIESDPKVFSQYPQYGSWRLVRLPKWAILWDNAFDGLWGDKRGWWANYCADQYNEPHDSHISMWRWAALRNPANYFSRNVCGVDVSTLTIQQRAGNISAEGISPYRGWYLLRGKDQNGKIYPRFYLEYAFKGTYGLMVDIGWKIKLSHNGTPADAPEKDRIKGIVFTLSPYKELS